MIRTKLVTKFLLLLLTLQYATILTAQDVVLKTNGDEIKAKVMEVGLTEIKYKRTTNLTGPTYTIPISDVFMITYENGDKDVFGRSRKAETGTSNATAPSATTSGSNSTGQSIMNGTNGATGYTENEATGQSQAAARGSTVSQTRKKEWTIFRTSNKEVIYTVKALVPEEEWDF